MYCYDNISKINFHVWPGESFSYTVVILCTVSFLGNSSN